MLKFFRTLGLWFAALGFLMLSSAAHAGSPSVLTFTKAFGASTIALNGTTSLTFNLSLNTVGGGGGSGAFGFTDTLPTGLVVASPNGLTAVSCSVGSAGAPTLTASAGGGVITVSGMSLSSPSNCSFSVNVTGTMVGTLVNSVTTTPAYIVGSTKTASASLVVGEIIPYMTVPPITGVIGQPAVLNMAAGNGPAMTTCMMDTVRGLFGADAVYVGQSASGVVSISQGGRLIAFYPLAASVANGQPPGLVLGGNNTLTLATGCVNFTVAPAVYNLSDFAQYLGIIGDTISINAQGVLTIVERGVTYVVRPDYFVTPGTTATIPTLSVDSNGLYRFTGGTGAVQFLLPAFLDTDGLAAQVSGALGGSVSIQSDGTALYVSLTGAQYILTPDYRLSPVASANAAKYFMQDISNHYMYRSTLVSQSQGFTMKAR